MSSFLYISATISDSKHSSNMKIIYIQYAYNLNAERERERERDVNINIYLKEIKK